MREFHAEQIVRSVRARWAGHYDGAVLERRVDTWLRRHVDDPGAFSSLLLIGPTGSGKTHAAVAAVLELGRCRAAQGRGLGWCAITHPDLAAEQRPSNGSADDVDPLQRYLDAELLVLDDLGSAMTTSWTVDWLQRLVDHRWTRRAATIYTTNLLADPLRGAIGDRVYSRLGDATHITLTGKDRRWRR